ncbi:MAG: hypothetical protein J0L94_15975 [Rhodothermia bacterium]|nr:hypothetical protein [Rhodothermia bacterium]
MKKNIFVGVSFVLLLILSPKTFAQDKPEVVGGDRDAHGCIGSAGYTWSVLKNSCIRIFENSIALDPKATSLDKTTVAYLVKKAGSDAKIEVFVPAVAKGIVLNRVKKNKNNAEWRGGGYTLKSTKSGFSLFKNKKLLYANSIAGWGDLG